MRGKVSVHDCQLLLQSGILGLISFLGAHTHIAVINSLPYRDITTRYGSGGGDDVEVDIDNSGGLNGDIAGKSSSLLHLSKLLRDSNVLWAGVRGTTAIQSALTHSETAVAHGQSCHKAGNKGRLEKHLDQVDR
jgi:hypothetical protein